MIQRFSKEGFDVTAAPEVWCDDDVVTMTGEEFDSIHDVVAVMAEVTHPAGPGTIVSLNATATGVLTKLFRRERG